MERQFDRSRSHDAKSRIAAQVWRSPNDVISASREMTADMVQPPADASIGIDVGSAAAALRSEARKDFDMIEQLRFSGMSANPVKPIQIHGALLCAALRGQQQK